MKTTLKKIVSLALVLCTVCVFTLTSCFGGGNGGNVISQNEMIDQLGGVSETFEGAISEESYASAEEAATAYVEEEIAGSSASANVTEVKSVATLSESEIASVIPESLREGVDSVEEYEVTYSINESSSYVDAGDNGIQALDTLNKTKTVKVYVIKCGPDWKYYTPMPLTGETISQAYYNSVFDSEKYKNCTFKYEQTMDMDISASGAGQAASGTMQMTMTQIIKHADNKVYLEQTISTTGTGVYAQEDVSNALSNMNSYAYMEEVDGVLNCYIKQGNSTEWVKGSLTTIGFSNIEELTPFYNQYLDYSYFTKTEYGFKLEKENAKQYVSQTLEQLGSMVDSIFDEDSLTIFAEYFVSNGVLSGMRMDMDINIDMDLGELSGGQASGSIKMSGASTGVMTCTNYGSTVVEKPFTE